MLGSFVAVALGLLSISPADTISTPRELVSAALRATEQGQADSLSRQWELRVSRDSSDRTALLGLATLARLRYDYGTAERLYRFVYSAGGTLDPGFAFRSFRGRDASVEPMLAKRGLIDEKTASRAEA